jgi:MSHA biogenesis protein MshQ
VTFSEAVTGLDAADFSLIASGLSSTSITSVTGSGSSYTVSANTGSGNGSLGLNLVNNSSINDLSSNVLSGASPFVGEVYTVDRANPRVSAIALANTSPSNAASLSWTVTFSKSVTGVDATDFQLVSTGTVSGATVSSVTGSSTNWTVTASGITGTGTLGLNVVDNDSIVDSLGNALGGSGAGNGNATGPVYTVDRTPPTVLQISRDLPSPTTENVVSWTVVFSESVVGVDAADFILVTSGLTGASITGVTGAGSTWSVTADPGYGAGTMGLSLVDDDSIVDAVGNKLGGTGSGNANFTGEVYTVSATPPLANYHMDEASWNGVAGEVLDEQLGNHGTAVNNATTANVTQALSGTMGTCRNGLFTSASSPVISKGYVDLTNAFPYMTDSFSITGWVRTTSNSTAKQMIFTHNSLGNGYALSLGTPGTGRLRFSTTGNSLDSVNAPTSLLANNTWYFVAAVADFSALPTITRTLYVFDTSGALLSGYPVSASQVAWDDTESGAATIGGDGATSFQGNLDEISFFDKALNQAALAALVLVRHPCGVVGPDHYEIALPSSSLSCLPTTVTVTACTNASSPCTNAFAAANGATATLSTSGATLSSSSITFNASGVATATLSYPSATNGSAVAVTLSGESYVASNSRQCCANGSSCSTANSCSTTFNTAGFLIAASAGGVAATVPAQVAGTGSGTYYLRAVKTNTTTQACESALSGSNTVNWAYQCNNPSTCSNTNLMSLNGGAATTIQANPNSGVSSTTPLTMIFDANGNAPFTWNYSDAGQVTLWASKSVNSAAMVGSSNAFVTKPASFSVSAIQQSASPNLLNPAAAGPLAAKFVKAGEAFSATVTAVTSGGVATPNFGRETTPEAVQLSHTLVQPMGGSSGSLSNGLIAGGSFSSGTTSVSTLAWNQVGIISLSAILADGDYLGAGAISGTASANVGRFYPDHFDTTVVQGCATGGFTYSSQPMAVTVTAKNATGATMANFDTASFAKTVTLTEANGIAGSLTAASVASTAFAGGVASAAPVYTFSTRTTTPSTIKLRATDAIDAENSATGLEGTALVRSGRLRMLNAYGSELLALSVPQWLQTQYWNGSTWTLNSADSCTSLAVPTSASGMVFGPGNLVAGSTTASINSVTTGSGTLLAGDAGFKLTRPGSGKNGYVDITVSTPAWLSYPWASSTPSAAKGRATFGTYKSPLIFMRENY